MLFSIFGTKMEVHNSDTAQSFISYPKPRYHLVGTVKHLCGGHFSFKPVLMVISMLVLASYGLAAEQDALLDVARPDFSEVDIESVSPEQVSELLRARSEQQSEEQPSEQSKKPQKVVPEDQKEMASVEGVSAIEKLLSGDIPGVVSTKLTQFGYDVFLRPVSTFAPVTSVPVGPDYVIGPGDSFTVTLWGRLNAQYTVTVNPSGEIALPEVGVLKVWGMSFSKLQSYLENEFLRKYTDFKMAVSMGRLRTITVYVVGEAQTQGSYTLSSLSTVINALFAASGPSKNGTLRDIRLLRGGSKPLSIDLYDFLLGGDKSDDGRLQDGDTIFIPLIGPVVGVAGNVKRPAIYEMSKPMTLAEVLELAGGVTYAGWLQRVQVERIEKHKRRIVVDFDISEESNVGEQKQAIDTILQDGDVVKVFAVSALEQNVVYLEGHVVRPGKYELKPGMRVGDIISSYSVLQAQPNLEYGEIERLVEPDYHPIVIPFNVGKILEGDESENIELVRFDTIRIFCWDERIKQSVSVSGLIFRPGEYRLVPGMKISDLINAGGGLKKNAYLKMAKVMRSHMSQSGVLTEESGTQIEEIDIDLEKAVAGVPEHNIALQDYDHLIVRPIDERFKRNVYISGMVFRPGEYLLTMDMKVSNLVYEADGLMKNAYLKSAEITRRHISPNGVQTEKINIDIGKALAGVPEHNITLRDYDHLIVRAIPELEFDRIATISGEVRFPGTYPIQRGERLSSLIERAGGYTERAYLKGTVFTRESARAIQQQRMEKLVRQVEENILVSMDRAMAGSVDEDTVKSQQMAFQAKKELLSKLMAAEITGRVVIKLACLEDFRTSKYDFELEKGDQLVIPETPGVVSVIGEVFNPTSLLYEKGETVGYYLRKVGGLTGDANKKQLSVVRADGSVVSTSQRKFGNVSWDSDSRQWLFGGFMSMKLNPGDTIVVPRKMDKYLWLRNTKDMTEILFQIALATGVVLAL